MDLSQYTDEELKQIAGSGKTDGVSSMSDEELMKIAGVDLPKREESTLGKVLNNSVVRGTVSGMQKMLDAWYNPVGQIAKGLNYSFGDGKWELPESLKPDITPRNATERAISNTLDYGQDALAFLGGGEALKSLGVLGKGVSKASKIARGIASGSVGDALASSAGAGTLTGIVNPQTWYGNLLTGVGGAVAGGGLLSGARAAKNAWNVRQGGKELQKQVVDRYVSPDGEYMPILKSIRRNMEKTNPEFKMATKDGKID